MSPTPTKPRRRPRAGFIVAGVISAVLAFGLVVGGGVMLYADDRKDRDGFVSTDGHEFRSGSAAVVSESMDIDLEGADWVVDGEGFGDVRLTAEPAGGQPLFVGIARTADVDAYLDGVAHSTVADVDDRPFEAEYRETPGARRAPAPADAGIWAASSRGLGERTLDWHVEDGDWSVVVMNADGSPGVTTDLAVGAKVPWLDEAGWGTLGAGAALYALAIALLFAGLRPRRDRPAGGTTPSGVAPAAA